MASIASPPRTPRAERFVFFVGMPGAGKTTVGTAFAARLGWRFVDLDDAIAGAAGVTVPALLRERGEAAFREIEAQVLRRVCRRGPAVIATGGGAAAHPGSIEFMKQRGLVVWLTAPRDVLLARTAVGDRPLLTSAGPAARAERLETLFAARAPYYRRAHVRLASGRESPAQLAARLERRLQAVLATTTPAPRAPQVVAVRAGGRRYTACILPGAGAAAGERVARMVPPGRLAVLADRWAWQLHGADFAAGLRAAGLEPTVFSPGRGEALKRPAVLQAVWRWLADLRYPADRPLVAFGGGAAGDLAGFAAATYRRGIPWAVVATTLLAQVDSALGGKTALNVANTKNVVGAYHQPQLVVAPLGVLATLPVADWRAGLAEAVKVAAIGDAALFARLERDAALLRRGPGPLALDIVSACYRFKARVVQQDERDAGPRLVLNFGHTLGHALEAVPVPRRLRHGEAVALGMVAAADAALHLGLADPGVAERLRTLLARLGLPTAYAARLTPPVIERLAGDKKSNDENVRFVVVPRIGEARIVPLRLAELRAVWAPAGALRR